MQTLETYFESRLRDAIEHLPLFHGKQAAGAPPSVIRMLGVESLAVVGWYEEKRIDALTAEVTVGDRTVRLCWRIDGGYPFLHPADAEGQVPSGADKNQFSGAIP